MPAWQLNGTIAPGGAGGGWGGAGGEGGSEGVGGATFWQTKLRGVSHELSTQPLLDWYRATTQRRFWLVDGLLVYQLVNVAQVYVPSIPR
jgi:hypothetical protein